MEILSQTTCMYYELLNVAKVHSFINPALLHLHKSNPDPAPQKSGIHKIMRRFGIGLPITTCWFLQPSVGAAGEMLEKGDTLVEG
jgi:hypothetical protein